MTITTAVSMLDNKAMIALLCPLRTPRTVA